MKAAILQKPFINGFLQKFIPSKYALYTVSELIITRASAGETLEQLTELAKINVYKRSTSLGFVAPWSR